MKRTGRDGHSAAAVCASAGASGGLAEAKSGAPSTKRRRVVVVVAMAPGLPFQSRVSRQDRPRKREGKRHGR